MADADSALHGEPNRVHTLKTWPPFFRAVVNGEKRYEIRKDDREPRYAVGDCLVLQEWNPQTEQYTGEMFSVRVTYLSASFAPEGHVVMSIEPWADAPNSLPGEPLDQLVKRFEQYAKKAWSDPGSNAFTRCAEELSEVVERLRLRREELHETNELSGVRQADKHTAVLPEMPQGILHGQRQIDGGLQLRRESEEPSLVDAVRQLAEQFHADAAESLADSRKLEATNATRVGVSAYKTWGNAVEGCALSLDKLLADTESATGLRREPAKCEVPHVCPECGTFWTGPSSAKESRERRAPDAPVSSDADQAEAAAEANRRGDDTASRLVGRLAADSRGCADVEVATGLRREPQPWQPMESAPTDGTNVLLWWPFWCKSRPTIGFFGYGGIQQWFAPEVLEGDGDPPLAWMPLPSPPAGREPQPGKE